MEKLLERLMLAMLDKQQAKGYDPMNAKCILTLIREYLGDPVENSFNRKSLLIIMFSNILILCANEGVTSEELMNFIQIDFENDNHKKLPSRLNTEYDNNLFTASCAALTGALSNANGLTSFTDVTELCIKQAKSLIDALNKE